MVSGCMTRFHGKVRYVSFFSRKSTGYITLRLLDGTRVKESASYKKIKLLRMLSGYLIESKSVAF